MDVTSIATAHAALGDVRRLRIVDQLARGDLTVAQIADLVGIRGSLLAHHLDVLDEAGLIRRRVSEGDHRRRYVSLRWDRLPSSSYLNRSFPSGVVFVCTKNSARSQFAAALWRTIIGGPAVSAGSHPAERVHPMAVRVAREFDVDISSAEPTGYESLPPRPRLLISVCDRARESDLPQAAEQVHWSIPDPVPTGTVRSFRLAFTDIADRVERSAGEPSA
jgi:protein-tyrosine-phosphatase/DNA-binding transcriptional ArsR family regulator